MNVSVALQQLGRLAMLGAIALIGLAFVEGLFQLLDSSLVKYRYSPGRLMEIALVLLAFRITVTVREIRDKGQPGQ
jgi:hypothetical protein